MDACNCKLKQILVFLFQFEERKIGKLISEDIKVSYVPHHGEKDKHVCLLHVNFSQEYYIIHDFDLNICTCYIILGII